MVHLRENILFYSWKNEFYNFVIIEECYVLYTSFFNSHIFKNRTFFWIILSESRGINFERFAYRIISIASILYRHIRSTRVSKQFFPSSVLQYHFFIARKLSCRFVSCDESEFWGWLLLPAQSKKTNVAKWLASSSARAKHSETLEMRGPPFPPIFKGFRFDFICTLRRPGF